MIRANVEGAYDFHVHSGPCLFERMGDDIELARLFQEAGMAGYLIKNHFESSVGRAYHASQQTGLAVYGGIVLNQYVGGINPAAVEVCLKMGGKQVWMPTVHSRAHAQVYGGGGTYGYQESGLSVQTASISVLSEEGTLSPAVAEVMALARAQGAIVGTCHLSFEEILEMARLAKDMGFERLLVTHPDFNPPALTVDQVGRLAELGCWMELAGGSLYPIPGYGRLGYFLDVIKAVGARQCIISSDGGQLRKSAPPEIIRVFAQCLLEKGVSQDDLSWMMIHNCRTLLGLE